MGLLWSGRRNKNKTTYHKKPSPALCKYISDPARDSNSVPDGSRRPAKISRGIKGRSLPILLLKEIGAGMTVEAALVLPLFCFFFLNLGCAMEMIRLHNNLQIALWDSGSHLAVYGYDLEGREEMASLFTAFYIKSRIRDCLGEEYLEQSPMTGGIGGLRLWESDMFKSDELNITATYQVSPWCSIAAFVPFRMTNRFCIHVWNGYRIPEESSDAAMVYVTEHGEVYHTSRDCTHLTLSIRQVGRNDLETLRNQSGRRYAACKKCAMGEGGTAVFVTEEGDCYHYSASCSGLKRTIYMISEEQAAGYRMCSRCKGVK